MTCIFYNYKKRGIEKPVQVPVPLKIARRITVLAEQLRNKEK